MAASKGHSLFQFHKRKSAAQFREWERRSCGREFLTLWVTSINQQDEWLFWGKSYFGKEQRMPVWSTILLADKVCWWFGKWGSHCEHPATVGTMVSVKGTLRKQLAPLFRQHLWEGQLDINKLASDMFHLEGEWEDTILRPMAPAVNPKPAIEPLRVDGKLPPRVKPA